jgi:GTP:adenosylcobinamide-phosphate guanylyltransferase
MDCVLVAGGCPAPDDPLFHYTGGNPKALLKIAGRPIIDYVLQALMEAKNVDGIVVVGLDAGSVGDYGSSVEFIADQGGLVANGLAGLDRLTSRKPDARHVLFASSDIPAATGSMIDDVVTLCRPLSKSAYYFMVNRMLLERAYPGSKRTYVRLRDMQVAGADIFIADVRLADGNRKLLHDMSAGRKKPWKMAQIAGPSTIIALLLHRLTLQGIEQRASRILGQPVSVSLTDHPQLAMDIDKPEQLELFRNLVPGL